MQSQSLKTRCPVTHLAKNTSARLGFQPVQPEVSIRYSPLYLNIAGASLDIPTCGRSSPV